MSDMDNIQQQLEQLHREFSASLQQRIEQIETDLHALQSGTHTDQTLASMYRQLHSLSGSAGTFHYDRLGEQCRQLEFQLKELIDSQTPADSRSLRYLQRGVEQLEELATAGPDEAEAVADPSDPFVVHSQQSAGKLLIYIVEDDPALSHEISLQLSHYGYRTCLFPNATQAKQAMYDQRPDLLLLDMILPEGQLGGADLANEIDDFFTDPPPIIFLSLRTDWEARLAAIRAGGRAYIIKPVNFALLLDQIENLTQQVQQEPFRVLVVEDVAELARHYALVLRQAGMRAEMITRPEKVLDKLESLKPELILLDLYLPDADGYEVAQVIHQHNNYFSVPIVFLSTEDKRHTRLSILQEGDDFLQKPILDNHLVTAIRLRIKRARALGRLMYYDNLTGLLNHVTLKLRLESELLRSQRQGSPLSYVMLDLDHFKQLNDRYGYPTGDQILKSLARLLRERLRKTDQIGRYGGEEFGIIMPDTDTETARLVTEQILARFVQLIQRCEDQECSCSFSAGIAGSQGFSHHDSVIAAADKALDQAKETGRNRVVLFQG